MYLLELCNQLCGSHRVGYYEVIRNLYSLGI